MVRQADHIGSTVISGAQAYLRCRTDQNEPTADVVQLWNRFFRVCDKLIRRFACAQGVPVSDLEDCAQEVWLKLVTALVEFRYDPARGQFRTWLYTVVRSAAANAHRRRKKQAAKDLSEDSPDVSTDAGGDPAAAMETSDTQRVTSAIVRSTLEKLRSEVSPANYQVLQLRFIDGLPVATVAERLGITPEQVWFRQCRGKKQLARLFSQRDCGEFDL